MLNKAVKHIRHGTVANAIYEKAISGKAKGIIGYSQNIYNITRYGWAAPRFGEIVWIIPSESTMFMPENNPKQFFGITTRKASGIVIDFWPEEKAESILEHWKIGKCYEHWAKGIPWLETGIYKPYLKAIKEKGQYKKYGFKSMDDIAKRYESLDQIFQQAKREGRLRTDEDINIAYSFQGKKGLGFAHFGPKCTIYWSGGAQHRLAIALVLQIPIPARIGVVHVSAIPYLKKYRKG